MELCAEDVESCGTENNTIDGWMPKDKQENIAILIHFSLTATVIIIIFIFTCIQKAQSLKHKHTHSSKIDKST